MYSYHRSAADDLGARLRHEDRGAERQRQKLLPIIDKTLAVLTKVNVVETGACLIKLEVDTPRRLLTKEGRSRLLSVFTVLRAVIVLFKTYEDSNLDLYGAFGYDIAFQFNPVQIKLERQESQCDLVLFLSDEILVVDRYSAEV